MNKINTFFLIMSFFFISCSTTNKTVKIGNNSFTYTKYNYDSWSSESVIDNAIGSFEIINDGSISLHEYVLGTYAIKVKIKNNYEEKEVCFIVDTGAQGNIIQKSILADFTNPFDEKFQFMSNFTYSSQLQEASFGVIVPELVSNGFIIKDILFEPKNIESFGWLDDGTPVNGFIGMITLSQMPFLFSAKDKKIVFFNENFTPKGKQADLTSKYPLVLQTPIQINKKTYNAKIDTGGETNLIPYSLYKKNSKYIDDTFVLKNKDVKQMIGLQKDLLFFDKKCLNIPTKAQKNFFMPFANNYVMIGETVLRNFDLYVDYQKSKIYFDPVDYEFPKRSMLMVYTSGGGNRYGYFGINLARDKWNKTLKVASIYYKDGKKLCPEISIGDYVISINGVDQKDFILENLQNYSEVEIKLRHKKKEYTVYLDRHYFDNCLEF